LALRDEGLLSSPTYWQLGFTGDRVPGGPPATARQLDAFLEVLPSEEPWTIHVRDGDGLEMAALAILGGGHVSIGIGDDPYQRLGLPTNSDLVGRVAHLAETIGRPVATQMQARVITGLHRSPQLRRPNGQGIS
jgi:3-keto-5-aminohexanoate cleavage enzyme